MPDDRLAPDRCGFEIADFVDGSRVSALLRCAFVAGHRGMHFDGGETWWGTAGMLQDEIYSVPFPAVSFPHPPADPIATTEGLA